MNLVQDLTNKKLITPPKWLPDNVHYLVQMGSVAYGVSDDQSDTDIYGFCIPEKSNIFPHLRGEIQGFGTQIEKFWQYQQHHIKDPSARSGEGIQYDVTIYSIVKFFQLCMENNPNMVDSLFVPGRCIRHSTQIGTLVRENRRIFLHKGCWPKFKGYARGQLSKMRTKTPEEGGKRFESVQKFGFDVKFAYHVVRLLHEVQQILETGDIDLERDREVLKSIRRGEWKEQEIVEYFSAREKDLESLYHKSTLPEEPREVEIKGLLMQCLEIHFGSLADCVYDESVIIKTLRDVRDRINSLRLD